MGDPFAEHATFILQQGTYPGDMLTRHRDPERFCVYHTMEDKYVILDREHRFPEDLCVPGRYLRDPDFALDCWYARQLGELYGYSPRQVRDHSGRAMESWYPENGCQTMGPVLADRVIEILSAYGPYPLDSDDCVLPDRFECELTEDGTYELCDYALAYKTSVSMDQLMNPHFEVANWYARKLTCVYEALCAGLSENNPEYNTLKLLDRGLLSEEECKLDKLARELYTPLPDAKFMYSNTHLFVIELNGQQIPIRKNGFCYFCL